VFIVCLHSNYKWHSFRGAGPDLIRDEKKLESPDWHKAVLKERKEAFAEGKIVATDWEQAKKRIKKKVACG